MTDDIEKLNKEIRRLEKTFAEEMKRKDKLIEELKEQNNVMFKAAVKSSEKIEEMTERLEKAMKKALGPEQPNNKSPQ